LAGVGASRFGDFIQSLKLIPRFGMNEGWRFVLARGQPDRQFEGGTSPMTVISLVELRPAAKGVSSPIADQAPALDALSIKRQYSKHPIDAESEPADLPDLAGGQVWVIEISPKDELATLHRTIVTESNVVIYDRSLEAIVAEALPLGRLCRAGFIGSSRSALRSSRPRRLECREAGRSPNTGQPADRAPAGPGAMLADHGDRGTDHLFLVRSGSGLPSHQRGPRGRCSVDSGDR
jgi:hypothetical protein